MIMKNQIKTNNKFKLDCMVIYVKYQHNGFWTTRWEEIDYTGWNRMKQRLNYSNNVSFK